MQGNGEWGKGGMKTGIDENYYKKCIKRGMRKN